MLAVNTILLIFSIHGIENKGTRTMIKRYDHDGWIVFSTRVLPLLHEHMKSHCIRTDVKITDFVSEALEEKLLRDGVIGNLILKRNL